MSTIMTFAPTAQVRKPAIHALDSKHATFMQRMAVQTAQDENGDRTYPARAPQGHQIGRWWNGYNYESNPNAEALARFDAQDKRGGAGV